MSGGYKKRLKTGLTIFFIVLMGLGLTLWLSGRYFLGQAVGLLGIDQKSTIVRADIIIGVPVVKIFWARNLRIIRQGPTEVSSLLVGDIRARWSSGWNFRLKNADLNWRGRLKAHGGQLGFSAAYNGPGRKISLTEVGGDDLVLSGAGRYPFYVGFKDISFQELALGLGRPGADREIGLWFNGFRAEEAEFTFGPEEKKRNLGYFSTAFSGHISTRDWAVEAWLNRLETTGAEPPPEAAEAEEPGRWAGWWAKTKNKAGEMMAWKKLLNQNPLEFSARGNWRRDEEAGKPGFMAWRPNISSLIFKGEEDAEEKSKLADWLMGCLNAPAAEKTKACRPPLGSKKTDESDEPENAAEGSDDESKPLEPATTPAGE